MCFGACGLVAQCDEYQLGGNEKAVLTCVLSILYSLNVVRNTCCVIDLIPLPIIYTHNGDGTFQNYASYSQEQNKAAFLILTGT